MSPWKGHPIKAFDSPIELKLEAWLVVTVVFAFRGSNLASSGMGWRADVGER